MYVDAIKTYVYNVNEYETAVTVMNTHLTATSVGEKVIHVMTEYAGHIMQQDSTIVHAIMIYVLTAMIDKHNKESNYRVISTMVETKFEQHDIQHNELKQ